MSRAGRRALVERENAALPVSQQCRLLAVSRSSVYRRSAEVGEEDRTIMALIDRHYLARPYYGSRRMAAWLATQGHVVNRKRVRRLMRLMGLVAIYQRPNTSKAAAAHKVYPYLLGGLVIERVNRVWCSDVTHPDGQGLPLPGGDYGLGEPCRAGVAAVKHARRGVLCRGPREALSRYGQPEIFNTDQGSQFTSDDFTRLLKRHASRSAWMARAVAWTISSSSGCGGALNTSLSQRLCRRRRGQGRHRLWLGFYNEERQHQSLGYRTPRQVYEAECPWIHDRSGCADRLRLRPHPHRHNSQPQD